MRRDKIILFVCCIIGCIRDNRFLYIIDARMFDNAILL